MLCELGNLIFLEKLHLISFLCTSNTSWNRTWCVTNLCLHSNWNSSYDGLVFTVPYFYHAYQRNYSPQNRISGGDCWEIKPFAHSQECWHCYQTKVCELGWRRQEIRWHSAHIFFNARLRRPVSAADRDSSYTSFSPAWSRGHRDVIAPTPSQLFLVVICLHITDIMCNLILLMTWTDIGNPEKEIQLPFKISLL